MQRKIPDSVRPWRAEALCPVETWAFHGLYCALLTKKRRGKAPQLGGLRVGLELGLSCRLVCVLVTLHLNVHSTNDGCGLEHHLSHSGFKMLLL